MVAKEENELERIRRIKFLLNASSAHFFFSFYFLFFMFSSKMNKKNIKKEKYRKKILMEIFQIVNTELLNGNGNGIYICIYCFLLFLLMIISHFFIQTLTSVC